jgi:organic radical activating enzyme
MFEYTRDTIVGVLMDGRELLAQQRKASRHFAFSVTQACPLRCEHCIVATVSAKMVVRASLTVNQVKRFASEMPALRDLGVERISVTGGEPLLVVEQVKILTEAAYRAGIESSIVTACHWAKTPSHAASMMSKLPHVSHWHLSTDRFHEQFIPLSYVANAIEAVRAQLIKTAVEGHVILRIVADKPLSDADAQFIERARHMLPSDIPVAMQPISKVGRAASLDDTVLREGYANTPCMTTGPLVRSDGSLSPCCSSLMDQRHGHPFQYRSVHETGLVRAFFSWEQDCLLRLLRAVGFSPILQWLRDEVSNHPLLRQNLPQHPCELCVKVWEHNLATELVREFVTRDGISEKIDELYEELFYDPRWKRSPNGIAR